MRGIERKKKALLSRIEHYTEEFPTEFYKGYWHLPLPADQRFINSNGTPINVKRQCMQALLDRAEHLRRLKPEGNGDFRVVVAVNLPDLWCSQLIVFKGETYFNGFFDRNNEDLQWLSLPPERNLLSEWGLAFTDSVYLTGFKEVIADTEAEYNYEGEIWFIGDMNR